MCSCSATSWCRWALVGAALLLAPAASKAQFFGACCIPGSPCVEVFAGDCLQQGGLFVGGPCNPNTCINIPRGACCLPNGSCQPMQTEMGCAFQGGLWRGPNVPCSQAQCEPFGGACCLPDGSCLNNSNPAACDLAGGSFQGPGSVCTPALCPTTLTGACCFPNGACQVLTAPECVQGGGQFLGPGSNCDPPTFCAPSGACCLPNGTCIQSPAPTACQALGGTFLGFGTFCLGDLNVNGVDDRCEAVPGACCLPDGTCLFVPFFDCGPLGGTWQGTGVPCTPTLCPPLFGACCLENGTCIVVPTPTLCIAQGGVYLGAGSLCLGDLNGNGVDDACEGVTKGACCKPDGDCAFVTFPECSDLGGAWIGPGISCAIVICQPMGGACCRPDGSCFDGVTPEQCANINGEFQGPGTTCANVVCRQPDMKWFQPPDFRPVLGMDVRATIPVILADDFECRQTQRITRITIWGSWRNDLLPPNGPGAVGFTLSFHKDIPADPFGNYSRPGEVLWFRNFLPNQFEYFPQAMNLQEGWWDPWQNQYLPLGDTVCWRYDFFIPPADAFCQRGTPNNPVVYWLDVQARPQSPDALFGWKTSYVHWNDDAVWGVGAEPFPGPWNELRYPSAHPLGGESIDLSFALWDGPPCGCKGDMNCDGVVNFADIDPFVLALQGEAVYSAAFPNCFWLNGDINMDNTVNFGDIDAFVALIGTICP